MSYPADLMADLFAAGVRLSVIGSTVAWAAPPGVVTPEVLALMRTNKDAFLDFILWTREAGEPTTNQASPVPFPDSDRPPGNS